MRTRAGRRDGFSYLEVCIATVILALCLIPAARALPTVLRSERRLETHFQLGLLAQETLEATVFGLHEDFRAREDTWALADRGRPHWRCSRRVHIPGHSRARYAVVRVRTWDEESGAEVEYATLVADRGRHRD